MDEREVRGALLEILRASLNGAENSARVREKIKPNILPSVYRLLRKQDLGHIAAELALASGIELDAELRETLRNERFASIYRSKQMKHALSEIYGILECEGIEYIPLKGAVLRPYYPYESMRTSCDIDVLVRRADLKRAVGALEAGGYHKEGRYFNDVELCSPNKIHLELHFNIEKNIKKLDSVLSEAWNHLLDGEGSRREFDKPFFIFYTFAHIAYHFLAGGCGLRSLLDIWVMEHRMDAPYSLARELLERAGIYKFAEEMRLLSERCFSMEDPTVCADPLLGYILRGGTYGSAENGIAMRKAKGDGRSVYIIKRIFLPYRIMRGAYPVLCKFPFLLPVFWVVRWVKALFGNKRKKVVSELDASSKMSDKKIEAVKALRTRLGV